MSKVKKDTRYPYINETLGHSHTYADPESSAEDNLAESFENELFSTYVQAMYIS